MLILDTDHLTALVTDRATSTTLMARLAVANRDVGTTIINVDEKLRGWLARIAKARTDADQVRFYAKFQRSVQQLGQGMILAYGDAAATRFHEIRLLKLGIGTMDAKIAAIVLGEGATLLSRNLRDFNLVPGLDVQDWI